jgi:hypothetical protein
MLKLNEGKIIPMLKYLSTISWRHAGVEVQLLHSWPRY